jgi:O-acetyl-ADP-ribose deacetylase (regulator of RNase III)
MLKTITGDLLDATEKYIAHQTNCVSRGMAAGIARDIFDKYPYSNIYANRTKNETPGTIDIRGNGDDQRFVINMNAQHYPGSSRYSESAIDDLEYRRKYFHQCLLKISKIDNLESIAFPFKIGCGIAGGNWDHYLKMLETFAGYLAKKNVSVVIYQRIGDK